VIFLLFYSCDGQDSIKIYIKIDNDEKELANTCGKKIPLMYMSNIAWMKVVFDSGSRTHTNTGFEMEYKFLTSKNREMLFHIISFYYSSK
jgi:N6-adenosine-specific RNA methylase IME4